jgi:hypothetical protein
MNIKKLQLTIEYQEFLKNLSKLIKKKYLNFLAEEGIYKSTLYLA